MAAKIPNHDQIQREMVAKYRNGASIRDLAAEYGRSYGYVHRTLDTGGVNFRPRGGANRKVAVNG